MDALSFAVKPLPPPNIATSRVRTENDAESFDDLDDLIVRAREGSLIAFEALYRRTVGRVHALVWRLVGDSARADELTQDVFVQVWSHLDGYRGESPFLSWVRTIALNSLRMDLRATARREERVKVSDDAFRTRCARVRQEGFTIDLERAMQLLPPGARSVFILHDLEQHDHSEVANLLGVTPGTSKTQLHRARKMLREALS